LNPLCPVSESHGVVYFDGMGKAFQQGVSCNLPHDKPETLECYKEDATGLIWMGCSLSDFCPATFELAFTVKLVLPPNVQECDATTKKALASALRTTLDLSKQTTFDVKCVPTIRRRLLNNGTQKEVNAEIVLRNLKDENKSNEVKNTINNEKIYKHISYFSFNYIF
jgi:hypothetical protein